MDLFGIVLFGALVANLPHTIVLRELRRSFGYALASFCFLRPDLPDKSSDKQLDRFDDPRSAAVEPMVCGPSAERKQIRRRSPRRTMTNAVLAMLGVPSRDPALPLWALVCDRYYIRRNDPCSTLSSWGCLRRR